MNTALTILGLLLAFMAGFFCAIKSVQLGLRWQIQTEQKQEPVLSNPITEVIENKQVEDANKATAQLMDEWMNGVKK